MTFATLPLRRARVIALAVLLVAALTLVVRAGAETPAAAAVPTGFTEVTQWSGLSNPTALRFAPDGRVFVAEKRGLIKMFDSVADTTPTVVADLRTEVYNYWDRGMLGLAVDPSFPARPYLYAMYTFDGPIKDPIDGTDGKAPRWGTGADGDPCPTPPGPTTDGCVVSGKLVRLALDLAAPSASTTAKTDLIHDWCQQYPSHSVGDIVFGRDGALYASGGDGASFNWVDYGQDGDPLNPCGDPPSEIGGAMTPPTAEGGALRAQDLRTSGDPTSLDGAVIRVSPDTGVAMPDNPNASSADLNAARIVAHGFRNPFRMTTRPGTDELWIGDVGWSTIEEINRLVVPTSGPSNFGWPCYEGDPRQSGYDNANLQICEDLYAQGTADTKPYFSYRHGQALNSSDNCNVAKGSSTSGLGFAFYSGGPYPAEYDGALFFSDFSRDCIWVMTKGTDGLPDKLKVKPFVSGAAGPVDVEISPTGEVWYADFNGGTIRRIAYSSTPPTTCAPEQYLAEYFPNTTLSGTPVTLMCEPGPLNHQFGAGGAPGVGIDYFSARWTGTFSFPSDATYTFTAKTDDGMRVWIDGVLLLDEWRNQLATFTKTRALAAGSHEVKIEYFETNQGAVAQFSWTGGSTNAAPKPTIDTPVVGTTWNVGDPITFSGSATDPEDGLLPASSMTWQLVQLHCPSACHEHLVQSWSGVTSGSTTAPDHEYPSYLEMRLTAVDSKGLTATVSRRLDPLTTTVRVESQPAGLQLTLGSQTAVAPFTRTLIVGSTASLSAPSPQTGSGITYTFSRWSDDLGQSHNIVAGSTPATYTATYTATGGCPRGQYRAEYFSNKTLSGTPARTACEAAPLDRTWGTGAPAGVGSNNFSARWTGVIPFPGGSTTFTAASDDGIRVWVDGVPIIDRWGGAGTTSATKSLAPGDHVVRVDYYEKVGTAFARVTWTPA